MGQRLYFPSKGGVYEEFFSPLKIPTSRFEPANLGIAVRYANRYTIAADFGGVLLRKPHLILYIIMKLVQCYEYQKIHLPS